MQEFEEILRQWERGRKRQEEERETRMKEALDRYPPPGEEGRGASGASEKPRIAGRRLPICETIDLHGLRVEEALPSLEEAIRRNSVPGQRRRILVIHGKGLHSSTGGKLRSLVRSFLRDHPLVGETGIPPAKEGGDGAVWAICRHRSR